MLSKLRNRFFIMVTMLVIIFSTLCVQLGDLTLAKGGEFADRSDTRKLRTLAQKGSRGQILDATGIPLAYDQTSFNVEFVRDPSKNTPTDKAYFTDIIAELIKIIEKNEGEIENKFAIQRTGDGSFAFDFGISNTDDIAKREKNWRENMFVSEKSTPDVIYRDLRNRYRIPEEMPYAEAIKVLGIWQDIQLSSYRAFIPVVVARNVDMQTVAELEGNSEELEGVQVSEASTRIYPKDGVAAHVIGYMGKMTSDETIADYETRGYAQDDLIGVSGIESSMENYLTGNSKERQGQREVEVNSSGKVIKELSYTPPKSGDSIMLTIDLGMQMALEQSLEKNIKSIREMQEATYLEKKAELYDEQLALFGRKDPNLANSGAAIVMDVKTGKVLAMANYPSYDLNMFTHGVSDEDYKALTDDKGAPLFNKAIASKGIPGSIFKMVTAMGGLTEGKITASETITDGGPYNKYIKNATSGEVTGAESRAPACWVKPYYDTHSHLNIQEALAVSCNYYFLEVADRLGIESINSWANNFGLTSLTNVELAGEQVGQVGNSKVLYDSEKALNKQKTSLPTQVKNSLVRLLDRYGKEREINYKDEQLEAAAQELVKLAKKGTTQIGTEIRAILSEQLEIPKTMVQKFGWDNQVAGVLADLIWNPTQTAIAGIGSGIAAITPIAAVRYVAAIANGGTVYDLRLVDRIIDENGEVIEQKESTVFNKIDAPKEHFDTIKEGMRQVVTEGTAAKFFENFKYKDNMAGKTGTGKVNNIDLENNAWFVGFAPLEDPEIAVVVYIPNGMAGSNAIPTANDIIGYYLNQKEQEDTSIVPSANSLILPKEDTSAQSIQGAETPIAPIAD